MKFFSRKLLKFVGLLVTTAFVVYFTSQLIASVFCLGLLVAYFYSEDEPFWLAFFFVIPAGIMAFFGPYSVVLQVVPGLPAIEVSQIYIILTIFKAARIPPSYRPFYSGFLVVLFIYLLFLIAQGYAIGFPPGLSRKFALLKMAFPMFLLFSIPRLFDSIEKYEECFKYLFFVAFTAFFSQIFSIVNNGVTPAQFLGAVGSKHLFFDVTKGYTYRGFFSPGIVLMTCLGAMVFGALKSKEKGGKSLLYAVLFANFLTAFFSATRGWIISFGIMFFLFYFFVVTLNLGRVITIAFSGLLLIFVLLNTPVVNVQIQNAFDRLMTVEALVEGDLSAGGTLSRVTERGPRVMKVWEQSKLTGWGFSETFREKSDLHVGNQNILLHSGIIGALLMGAFFLFYNYKLFQKSINLKPDNPARGALLSFIFFFIGWFFIHSTSSQQFAYYSESMRGIQYALFFCFGALLFEKAAGYEPEHEQNKLERIQSGKPLQQK